MRLKVGIDVDGVLTHAASIMVDLINEHPEHGHSLSPENIAGYDWDFYRSYCESCFRDLLCNPEFARRCVLYPGTREALASMAEHVDLYGMTHRHETIQPATIEWLQANRIYNLFTNVWFERFSKAERACREGLDYHIDDSPNVILDWSAKQGAIAPFVGYYPSLVIYSCNYNQHFDNFRRVDNLTEFAAFIVERGKTHNAVQSE